MIFDTCFIIDVMDGDEKAISKLKDIVKRDIPQITTAISIFEIFSGMSRCNNPENEKRKIIDVLENLLIADIDNESAQKSGTIDGELIKTGKPIGVQDILIAGVALKRKDTLLTRNIKDFERIKNLKIESY